MDSKFFEKWFKEMFLNEVEKNKAIVMDNATFHCKSRLYELCKNANKNLKLIFLPPYSPNLNPIEKYWATLKKNLKKITKNNKSLEESIYELFKFDYYNFKTRSIKENKDLISKEIILKAFNYRGYKKGSRSIKNGIRK